MSNQTQNSFVSNEPLTTKAATEVSPELLQSAIDQRIVRIRPMSTPIDQISRCAGARRVGSMKVEYYSVDTKATAAQLTQEVDPDDYMPGQDNSQRITLHTDNNQIFDASETVMVPGVVTSDGSPVVFYIEARDESGLTAVLVNRPGEKPAIAEGAKIVRMGRAAAELDVQTAQFQALPKKCRNNCQIFKMQVEESTLQRIANKEVGWGFTDQEEVAIMDMRMGIERSFLFGVNTTVSDETKQADVFLTGGIWNQTSNDFEYTDGSFTSAQLVSLCRKAFTNNSGSARKILLGGSGLIERLSNMEYNKVITAGETRAKWGLEFREIRSNFGSLYVIHSETFDQCGHEDDGFIIDPDYITKYTHIPFQTEKLDLRRTGQRNTEAVVITEASCLVLRHPNAHVRVIKRNN